MVAQRGGRLLVTYERNILLFSSLGDPFEQEGATQKGILDSNNSLRL